jgi:hypothetical protein
VIVLSHSVCARKVFIANPPVATGIVRASRLGHKATRSSDRRIRKGCAQNDDAAQFLSRATRRERYDRFNQSSTSFFTWSLA